MGGMDISDLTFIDNPVATARQDRYTTMTIDVGTVLASWRGSLFSYEWLDKDGKIKPLAALPLAEQPKRREIEEKISKGGPLEKPVLGIGLMGNVEIGSGRATFLTLAAHGCTSLPVHIPVSNADDLSPFGNRS